MANTPDFDLRHLKGDLSGGFVAGIIACRLTLKEAAG